MKKKLIRGLLAFAGVLLLATLTVSTTHSAAAAVPEPPANVQPAWIHGWPANYARLTWDASPGATAYTVYRSNEMTLAWDAIASGQTNRIVFDPTAGAPEKSYRVTAVGPEGESAPSETVTTHDSELITAFWHNPPSLWEGTLTPTSATIQWVVSLVVGCDGMLELGTDPTNFVVVHFDPEYRFGFSVGVSNLLPQTQYYYRITGVGPNRAGQSAIGVLSTPEINDPPVVEDLTWPLIVDPWPVTIQLSFTDSDGAMFPLALSILSPPTNGTLSEIYAFSYTGPYYVDYTPNAGARGPDSFQWQVADGELLSLPATVSFPSLWLNRAPQAASFATNTLEDVPLALTFAATDEDGDALTFEAGGCLYGTVTGTPPGIVYIPNADFAGEDVLLYSVTDGYTGGFAQGVITITVTPVNDAPVAQALAVSTPEDAAVPVTLVGSDVESGPLTFTVVGGPTSGTLSGTAPNLVYTPAANYAGADSLTYVAHDGELDSAPVTVSLTVTPVNDAPVAQALAVSTPYNTPVAVTLTGSDAEGSSLVFTVLSSPAGGTLGGAAPNLTFTPNIGWSGETSFTFKVNDGALDSAVATVSLTVSAPTAPPPAPTALTATAASRTQINLSWVDAAANEDGFKVERSSNGSSWTQIATVGRNVTTYASTGLSANKIYYYRVRAYNVLGHSPYSNTASARTLR